MEINFFKALITVLNLFIIFRVPVNTFKCRNHMLKQDHGSFEWAFTIVLTLCWLTATGAEFPALLARYLSYYNFHLELPQVLYIVNLWDRWFHWTFYIMFELLTYMWISRKIPKIVPTVFGS